MINIDKLKNAPGVEVTFAETNVDKDYVKHFRNDHNLTQTALANILGVTKKAIEKWEQGVNKISGSSAVLLKLLNDNPELIKQLYSVTVVLPNNLQCDEYQTIEYKVVESEEKPIILSLQLRACLV